MSFARRIAPASSTCDQRVTLTPPLESGGVTYFREQTQCARTMDFTATGMSTIIASLPSPLVLSYAGPRRDPHGSSRVSRYREVQEWINTGHELGASKFDPLPGTAVQQVVPTPTAPAPPQNAGEKLFEFAEAQRKIPSLLAVDMSSVNMLKGIGVQADFGVESVNAGLMTNEELKAALDTYVNGYFYDPRIHGLDPTRSDLEHTTANINLVTGWIG